MVKTFRTPKGKHMTPRQYLALVRMQQQRGATEKACEHGHFACAGWEGGPCSAAVASDAAMH